MTTYARVINGVTADVVISPPTLQERFNAEWLSRQIFVVVPDGTKDGGKDNGDGTFTNPVSVPTVPTPNNHGNPYWPGYAPKTQLGFWGLVQKVFIFMAGSNEGGADRFNRLTSDARASGIVKMIGASDTVDPDDRDGAFLSAVSFLTTTTAAVDNKLLMTTQEVAAIMQSSNWTK